MDELTEEERETLVLRAMVLGASDSYTIAHETGIRRLHVMRILLKLQAQGHVTMYVVELQDRRRRTH